MKDSSSLPLFLLPFLIACGPSFQAATPPGFVELEDQHAYDYRATTADGLVISVREIEHEPKGEMDFWKRAIENQMRQRGGYALLGSRDVKSADGIDGKQLRFGHDEQAAPHLYYVTIFVTKKHIHLLEAGGTKALMEQHAEQLDWAIKNFRTN
jgi:hypothetical protein